MKKRISFNTNEYVYVKLTPVGLLTYRKHQQEVAARLATHGSDIDVRIDPKLNNDGYFQIQLWEAMRIFGPSMFMARPVPFVDNVIEFNVETEP